MKLHEYTDDFSALTSKTAEMMKIPELIIEKDYWVTYILWNLANSEFSENVIFKGGTSLSKAYKCIERFSEDIDFAIKEKDTGDSKRKTLMKAIEKAATTGLTLLEKHPQTVKFGRNRKTFYDYSKTRNRSTNSFIKDTIQLEINTFTHPSPAEKKQVNTFIYEFLNANGLKKEIEETNLKPFNVLTLSIERTLCEKILSLIRISYEGTDILKTKNRHFYDIAKILQTMKITDINAETFKLAFKDDKDNSTFNNIWTEMPLKDAPLFKNFNEIWKSLEKQYFTEMQELCWNNKIPPTPEIKKVFQEIRLFITHTI